MKSILKTFNAGFISNFALIGILSVLTTACGSDADSSDPRRYDINGPEIVLNPVDGSIAMKDDEGNATTGMLLEIDSIFHMTLEENFENRQGLVMEVAIDNSGEKVDVGFTGDFVDPGAEVRDTWDMDNITKHEPQLYKTTGTNCNSLADNDPDNDDLSSIANSVDSSVAAMYCILYSSIDASGNLSKKTRIVEVTDLTKPVITLSESGPLTVDPGTAFIPPLATYTDEYDFSFDDSKMDIAITNNQSSDNHCCSITATTTSDEGEIDYPIDNIGTESGSFKINYSAKDESGNIAIETIIVIVEPDYQDKIIVFKDGAVSDAWQPGIGGYDQDLNWGGCGAGACPNIDFGLKSDPSKESNVIYVDHAENNKQAGFFIQAATPNDLGGANINGKLSFEVWSEKGVELVTGVDCPTHPQVSNPVELGIVGKGVWQEISIPASELFTSSCATRMDKIGTMPFFLKGFVGDEFRLDNIVWYCEFSCSSQDDADKEYTPWVKVDKSVGYDAPDSYDGYNLVWSDEFNGTQVDPTKWNLIDGGGGFGNNELQYYRADNASVEDGLLAINVQIQQDGDAPLSNALEDYSSAKLTTQEKFEFKHGRVDIRAAVAEGKGMWSAGWMLGANVDVIGWPYSGEIDIVETIGGTHYDKSQEERMVHNAYWNNGGPTHPAPNTNVYDRASYSPTPSGGQKAWGERVIGEDVPETIPGETFSNTFHVFSIEWDEDKIRYMIDGVHKEGKDLDLSTQGAVSPCAFGQGPNQPELSCVGQSFNNDFFLILNVAVGGTFPGSPDNTTQFPRGMLVDYVRVYQTTAQEAAQDAQ